MLSGADMGSKIYTIYIDIFETILDLFNWVLHCIEKWIIFDDKFSMNQYSPVIHRIVNTRTVI